MPALEFNSNTPAESKSNVSEEFKVISPVLAVDNAILPVPARKVRAETPVRLPIEVLKSAAAVLIVVVPDETIPPDVTVNPNVVAIKPAPAVIEPITLGEFTKSIVSDDAAADVLILEPPIKVTVDPVADPTSASRVVIPPVPLAG